jgi:hypothetical protein
MDLFVPFVILLAFFWLTIGIMIARYAQQTFKGKPWKSTIREDPSVYGGGTGHGMHTGRAFGGDQRAENGGRVFGAYEKQRQRPIGLGQFGPGSVKGL